MTKKIIIVTKHFDFLSRNYDFSPNDDFFFNVAEIRFPDDMS